MLSIVVPPVAGVYLPRFFLDEYRGTPVSARNWDIGSFVALVAGVAAAGLAQRTGIGLTRIAPLDSLLVSAVVYISLDVLRSPDKRPAATEC